MPAASEALSDYDERLKRRELSGEPKIWALLDSVNDPEIPVLSLWDLGVLSNVERDHDSIIITMTPTYSGCPAVEMMREDMQSALQSAGYQDIRFKTLLSPAWSSDWISPDGRKKMKKYGIAPPNRDYCTAPCDDKNALISIPCPHCGSNNTQQISEFGSTACKALHRCLSCLEPFDYFKSI